MYITTTTSVTNHPTSTTHWFFTVPEACPNPTIKLPSTNKTRRPFTCFVLCKKRPSVSLVGFFKYQEACPHQRNPCWNPRSYSSSPKISRVDARHEQKKPQRGGGKPGGLKNRNLSRWLGVFCWQTWYSTSNLATKTKGSLSTQDFFCKLKWWYRMKC